MRRGSNPLPVMKSLRSSVCATVLSPWGSAAAVFSALLLSVPAVRAQSSDPAALSAVRAAVQTELNISKVDHSSWDYRDHDVQPGHDAVTDVIETPKGDLHRLLMLNGHPLTGADQANELNRLRAYVNSPEEQARKRKDAAHDDAQARELLGMLPDAFVWAVARETPEEITLHFQPNPAFKPPDMQSRVMGTMAGEMVIAREGDRIKTLRGALTDDVKIGFGIFGKLDKGGTFDIERRKLVPGHWQITETHVHIGGRALLFKSIGTQEDEVKTDWKPSTAATLEAALEQISR